MEVIKNKLKNKLKEKKGLAMYPIIILVIVCFVIFGVFFQEYFKVRMIMENVRDTLQSESIQNIVSNYANVYHSARESYTTGYVPNQTSFEEKYINDIEEALIKTLKLNKNGSKLIKIANDKELYSLTDVKIQVYNPSLRSGENVEIQTKVELLIPVKVAFINIDFEPTVNVNSKYVTKF